MTDYKNLSNAYEVISKKLTFDFHHYTNESRKAFAAGDLKTAKEKLVYATRSSDFHEELSSWFNRWMSFCLDIEFREDEPPEGEPVVVREKNKLPRAKKTSFAVKLPDGRLVKESTCAKTFARTIELIGPEEVAKGGFMINRVPLVTNDESVKKKAGRIVIADGWTVRAPFPLAEKRIILRRVATFLGIKLEILEIA